ncbi:hypothetical protein PR202_gb00941 [Eleusine coracana subsp. coracana]|uniref:RING-type E3 ubiquitin transferase n=1 Tax=Eleusine coracana subsp. coracana TaxID=191504 RepID=A0AAV5DW49_ELECO|nr:hypothetical protein QOZ80_5BG0423600 [Eleusine coracana subsp. coracana]GJN14155.1 hypothetical protein PR202_gb00941 [Eleusine coracana subsp. coracana]
MAAGAAADHHPLAQQSPSAAAASSSWTPHGRALTACLVALNVFLVLLVYVYFWRFFSRAPRRADHDDEEDPDNASSSDGEEGSSPPPPPKAREVERAIAALPVFVHSSSSPSCDGGGGSSAAAMEMECAICIAEFADGEQGRLLPRCGHRFHARCVDTWFRSHATCPLCRDTVLHVAGDDADTKPAAAENQSSDTDLSSDCPV